MTSLALIDLPSILVPMWKAIPATEPADAPHDACIRRVRAIASQHDHCAIAIDSPRSARRELFAAYKANRALAPHEVADRDAMIVQLRRTAETLRADGFAVWEADGLEADDVIATAVNAMQTKPGEWTITIYSADKDLRQLVNEGVLGAFPEVVCQSPRLEKTEDGSAKALPIEDFAAVVARYGISPDLLGDWLSITGDQSDNVPGIPKIGPKGATALLQRFGTLEAALEAAAATELCACTEALEPGESLGCSVCTNGQAGPGRLYVHDLKPGGRRALIDNAEQARLSRELVRLRTDAPIDVTEALKPRVYKPLPRRPDAWDERDNPEDHYEESPPMNETNLSPEPQPEPEPAAAAAPTNGAKPTRVIELDPPPRPADAVERLAQFLPGTDAWAGALEPDSAERAWHIATKIHNARLFQFANVEQCFAAIMLGRSLGLGVMTICRNVHLVKGKLTLHVDLLVGLVRRSPLCEYWQVIETTHEYCIIEAKRRGNPKATTHRYDLQDAIDAKLLPKDAATRGGGDSTWDKFRRAMLRHGCERDLARMDYQDITAGLYTVEEMTEYSELPTRAA